MKPTKSRRIGFGVQDEDETILSQPPMENIQVEGRKITATHQEALDRIDVLKTVITSAKFHKLPSILRKTKVDELEFLSKVVVQLEASY